MKDYYLPKNQVRVKKELQARLRIGKRSLFTFLTLNRVSLPAFSFLGLALITLFTGQLTKNNSVLAGFNPLASPEAKAKHLVKSAVKETDHILQTNSLGNAKFESLSLDLKAALSSKDITLIQENETSLEPSEQDASRRYEVDGQVVDNIEKMQELKPKEVKRQVRFTREDGSKVFLGFDRSGQVIFRAEELEEEDEREKAEENNALKTEDTEKPEPKVQSVEVRTKLNSKKKSGDTSETPELTEDTNTSNNGGEQGEGLYPEPP